MIAGTRCAHSSVTVMKKQQPTARRLALFIMILSLMKPVISGSARKSREMQEQTGVNATSREGKWLECVCTTETGVAGVVAGVW